MKTYRLSSAWTDFIYGNKNLVPNATQLWAAFLNKNADDFTTEEFKNWVYNPLFLKMALNKKRDNLLKLWME